MPSISHFLDKIKPFYNLLLILVIASIFFALGRLSGLEERRVPIRIDSPGAQQTASVIEANTPRTVLDSNVAGEVIGSKNGTKYYFPWCGSAARIKPENQVKFTSVEAARAAGYTPAANCKGLK
ncbi:MAG TPA: hypothetical protein VJC13_02685 [Candidatus Paceibacterota bacterium]